MELEKQFHLALQADQTSSKMKAARLNAYWRKICEDERKAKQRNEMMMREFERMDAHMAEMNARTQRLSLVKKQYEDYISRTYPQWDEFMHGSSSQQNYQQQQSTKATQLHKSSQPVAIVSNGTEEDQGKVQHQIHMPKDLGEPTDNQQQEQPVSQGSQQSQTRQVQEHSQTTDTQQQSHSQVVHSNQSSNNRLEHDSSLQEMAHSQFRKDQPQVIQHEDNSHSEYANLPGPVSRQGSHETSTPQQYEQQDRQQQQQQTRQASELNNRTSEINGMSPVDNEEAEDVSDFGSDTDIPMGQSLGNTQVRVDTNQTAQTEEKTGMSKFTGSIRAELSVDGLFHLLHLVEADVGEAFSLEGYYRSSWPDSATKANIIRAANAGIDLPNVDVGLVSMVVLEQITLIVRNLVEKSLLPQSILEGNISTLTAAKLRQHLSPEAQVIWDGLFSHFVTLVKAGVMEPQELSAIFTPCMVAGGGAQEKGHSFIVQLLEGIKGDEEGKTVVPSNGQKGTHWGVGVSSKSTLEGSGSFADDGRVPPLKFGSLLDKPLSDDESSYINSSLPRDAVPLNETAAYKNMISGTASYVPPRQQSSGPEDTDDDVEKQVASAIATKPVAPITPRTREVEDRSETSSQTATAPTASHVYVPTALETSNKQPSTNPLQRSQNKFQGVKISSDLDTDTEVDVGIFGSSRKPSDNFDYDFYD